MRRLLLLLAALTASCGIAPCFADEAVTLGASAWTRLAVGRPDSAIRYGGRLELEGPIIVGQAEKAHTAGLLGLSIELESLPTAEGLNFSDPGTWANVLQVTGYAGRRVGDATIGDQHITTTVVGLGRFATAFRDAEDTAVRKRFYRAYGAGLLLQERTRGSWILVAYGRDEAVGAWGWGQLQLEGEIALAGPVRFYGRASLGFGPASLEGAQADFVTFGIGVSLPDLAGVLKR